ncbi:MAG TPA: Crp/Fnr family transcriptional regulator [Chitinophaga sp.]|uniref:Crp/Fnr family transcriptional regulator n=1 Tax=Chitinophaga sp. TaxID=1869181 RepID=UPI002C0849DA|nr:Crp/Fnr family transcriptional regulator [Chitinophaga sp.]HVI49085.1 Crp/Fnr family transcriptional regulator [Chitinophaga sp.]
MKKQSLETDQAVRQLFFEYVSAGNQLSASCAAALWEIVCIRDYPKNHTLVRGGEYSDKLFFVIKGAMRAYFLQNDKDVTDWFALENSFIAAVVSFLGNVASPHYLETIEPSQVLYVHRGDLEILCGRYHELERLYRLHIADTLLKLQQNIIAQRFKTAQERYADLMILQPDLVNRVPLKHIATYLGISQESLSRIRARI